MDPRFWRGRRVLLTGHTGFKGSWLSLWLQSLGAQVCGFALAPSTQPNLFEAARVAEGMDSVIGDIRDEARVHSVMDQARPEVVIHMAAQPLVQDSYEQPVYTYAVNVMGTVHVLEAARRCASVRAVLNVTSDKCYAIGPSAEPCREGDAMGGRDPYSSSKGCAELVTAAYRASFFSGPQAARVATARAGNVIGGGDWAANRLVPDLIAAFAAGRPAQVRHPAAVRPWQHVLEPLRGYLMLAERLHEQGEAFADAWNFGPALADAQPVADVASRLAALWGAGARWSAGDTPPGGYEAPALRLNADKARRELGWSPVLDLHEALALSASWYRDFLGGADARTLCLRQIETSQRKGMQ